VADGRVLIDPMIPPEGLEWFEHHGIPEHVVLSNRHHDRHSWQLRDAFGCTVHCISKGVHELDFDLLLLAHGAPVVGGGREALRTFVG
jgi:hypothetical protein